MSDEVKNKPKVNNSICIKVTADTTEAEKAVERLEQQLDRLLEKQNRLLTALADAEKAIGSTKN